MTNTPESKLAAALRAIYSDSLPVRLRDQCNEALAAYDASLKHGAVAEPAWHTNPSIDASARRVFGTPPTPHATTDTMDAAQGDFVLVPREPTEEMLIAALKEMDPIGELVEWYHPEHTSRRDLKDFWRVMLAAAPVVTSLCKNEYLSTNNSVQKAEVVNQPVPAEQQAASKGRRVVTDAKEQAIADIIRDMCESDPADPQKDTTVCINVSELEQIVRDHCETFASTLPVGDEGMRAVIAEVAAWHRKMNLRLSGMGTGNAAAENYNCPHGRFATALEAIAAQTAGGGK